MTPLPERLVMELTAHRTLALREAIGRSPGVALCSETPRGALMLRFPSKTRDVLFPRLFDVA